MAESLAGFIRSHRLGVFNTSISFIIFLISFFLISQYNDKNNNGKKKTHNSVSYAVSGDRQSIYKKNIGNPVSPILLSLYEGLFKINESGEVIPGSIEYCNFDESSNTYEFLIKKNALWSNGDQLKASDFVRSIQELANPSTKSPHRWLIRYIKNGHAILSGKLHYKKIGAYAINDRVLKIIPAKNAFNAFFDLLSTAPFLPVHKDDINTFNGPFKILKDSMVLNEKYYAKNILRPKEIILRFDNKSSKRSYKKSVVSNIDIMKPTKYLLDNISIDVQRPEYENVISHIDSSKGTSIKSSRHDYLMYCDIHHKQAKVLQKTMNYALNREKIISSIFTNRYAKPAYGILPWGNNFHKSGDFRHNKLNSNAFLNNDNANHVKANQSNGLIEISTNLNGLLFDIVSTQMSIVNIKLYKKTGHVNLKCYMKQAYYNHPSVFVYQIGKAKFIDAFDKKNRNHSTDLQYYDALAKYIIKSQYIIPLYFTGQIAITNDSVNFNIKPYGRSTPLEYVAHR